MTETPDKISELSIIQEKVATVAHTENPAAALDAMLKNHAIVLVGGGARITNWRQRGLKPRCC